MKAKELREKTVEQLNELLVEKRREQFNLRMQGATDQLSRPHLFKRARRDIARVKTVLGEKATTDQGPGGAA